jgi:transcriptional regulator with XRE-family HTH domain
MAESENLSEIRAFARGVREAKELTRAGVAAALDCSVGAVGEIERDGGSFSLALFLDYLEHLGVWLTPTTRNVQ